MPRRRSAIAIAALALGAAGATACGTATIKLDPADRDDPTMQRGAQLFYERCSGCHTLTAAGAEGSSTSIKDRERVDGPNFDVRKEQPDQVLYAIRNGGFSGAIMPQNIVTGKDAEAVALFLAKYAGRQAEAPKTPGSQIQPEGGGRPEVEGASDEPQGEEAPRAP